MAKTQVGAKESSSGSQIKYSAQNDLLMYLEYWQLQRSPFPSRVNPQLFYEGMPQREALARLRYVVQNSRQLGLLLGESGSGKTQLLQAFVEQSQQTNTALANIDLLGLSSAEFFWRLGSALQAPVQPFDTPVRLFRQISDLVTQNHLLQIPTVFLFDNCDQAGPDLLTQLLRVVNLSPIENGLSVILTANRSQAARLGSRLLELVDLNIELPTWDELDTTGYLQFALFESGAERPLFDDLAVTELHHLAGGNPRKINRLAEYALLLGAESRLTTIDPATIRVANQSVGENALVGNEVC